ncbi:MAG: TRAP transporter large permease subunit [Beijerinckiaceae bacterium]
MLTGITAVAVAILVLLVLFGLGLPIVVAFLLANLIGVLLLMGPAGFGMFANSLFDTATTVELATIPLFLLVGELLFRGRAIDVLFESVDTLVSRMRGRQYVLTMLLSVIFAALSGAAMGVAAMLGRSVLPGMQQRGYDPKLSAGAILAGASLAPIIPPSVLAIIIGTLAGVSISGLLIAGIIPGLILAGLFFLYIFARVAMNASLAPVEADDGGHSATGRDKLLALARMTPFSLIIIFIMGFILLGITTPSESAATGVIGALLAAALYRRLTWRMVWDSLRSSMAVASMILVIMASSKMFGQFLAFTGGTTALTEMVSQLNWHPAIMFFVLMLFPFIFCMFIDQIALMLIVIPIYKPLIATLGFDPIWFWLIFLINITIGGITPPFGYTLFALKGAAPQLKLGEVFSSAWPFVWIFLFGIFILWLFPALVTYLPSKV